MSNPKNDILYDKRVLISQEIKTLKGDVDKFSKLLGQLGTDIKILIIGLV